MSKIDRIRRLGSHPRVLLYLISFVLLGFAVELFLGALGSRLGVGALFGAVAFLALVLLTAMLILMNIGAVDTDGAEAARQLASDPQAQKLLQCWIVRARWYRYVGGAAGVGFALGWSGHFVLCGVLGIMVGAVASESARIGKPVEGPRTAELTRRPLHRYVSGGQQYVLYLIAALGIVAAALAISKGDFGGPLYAATAAVMLIVVVLLMQWRVVARRRPALAEPLRWADDVLRYLANTRGLADPAMALGFALLAETFGVWGARDGEVSNLADLAEVVFFVLALGIWWQNRRLGLESLSDINLAHDVRGEGRNPQINQTSGSSTNDS